MAFVFIDKKSLRVYYICMNYFDNKKSVRTVRIAGFTDEFRRMLECFLSSDFIISEDDALILICEDGKVPKNHPPEKTVIIGDKASRPKSRAVYFPRPVDLSALRSVALTLADADEAPASPGEYVADPTARSVSLGGMTVHLTALEFRLFMLLNSRIGEAVSREDIRRALQNGDSGSNMPDVYICYLRKKLESITGSGALISLRGKGYMLTIPK